MVSTCNYMVDYNILRLEIYYMYKTAGWLSLYHRLSSVNTMYDVTDQHSDKN